MNKIDQRKIFLSLFAFTLIIILLIVSELYSYLLFHNISEILSITIAAGIFVIGWNTRNYSDSSFFTIFGISSLFTGIIDIFHTLSYEGMAIFLYYTSNLPTQLWIIARFMQSISLFLALILINRSVNYNYMFLAYTLITFILISLVFLRLFPTTYLPGYGLTLFKIICEYIIILILAISIYILFMNRNQFSKRIYILILISIIASIFSELSFTFYIDVYDLSNFIGHVFKIIAFLSIYAGILQIGLENPIEMLFKQLKDREQKLTDLYKQTNFYKDLFTHDIANVIQNLISNIELINHYDKDNQIDPKIKNRIDLMNLKLIESKKLIRNILMLTNIEEMDEVNKSVNLLTEITEAIHIVRNSYPNRKINLNVEKFDKPIYVRANEFLIGIIENILNNAVKYNNSEIIRIQIKHSVLTKHNKEYIKLEFIDNGIGISPQQKEIIFKKGYKTRKGGKGLGLGLSLVQKIVKLYEGEIWVENRVKSDYSKGSNFVVLLQIYA
ncbi:MAG: hypothetical protein GF317_22880 [Candidatus Lokiarchaeota archaeon]|nr:hypothetical protein [Candidatus Lokiarchaeota archaeon]MBD3202292.1 hypothetical protein [Candidatus Lokiarchaeota archaeon]